MKFKLVEYPYGKKMGFDQDIVLGFVQKNNKDNWYSIEVTFDIKPVIKNNYISLEI